MENRTQMGMNRTGMSTSPAQMGRMQEVTDLTLPSSEGDEQAIADLRAAYIREAEPLGSMPPPLTPHGAAKAVGAALLGGHRAHAFIDKLGERLAFERSGVRLYDALIAKCEAAPDGPDESVLGRLRHFRNEEAQHFVLVKEAIEAMGGDPTAQTPCADVVAVESMGLMQVVTDPKTTVNQSVHAILVAELADNDAWEQLVLLAREMGQAELAERFEEASRHEMEHLTTIQRWHQDAMLAEVKIGKH
jgi:rubrerythrin